MRDIIKVILYEWLDRKLPQIIPRELNIGRFIEDSPNKILVITGFRRVGKTYLGLDYLNEMVSRFDRKQIVYINFEDERIPLETPFLTELLPTIIDTLNIQPVILLLDEIHQMPGWSKWLRRLHETTSIRFIITGSNSKMGTSEIPTELRGRYIEKYLSPLSFREYLRFREARFDLKDIEYKKQDFLKLQTFLEDYLQSGGLPEVVLSGEVMKTEIVQSYFKTMVSRDIAERHQVRNITALRALLKLLLNSKLITLTRLHNSLKSMGISVSKNTVSEYLRMVEDVYFFKFVTCFSHNVKNEYQLPRKSYVVDAAFMKYLSSRLTRDTGWLYEIAVAHQLAEIGLNFNYWKARQQDYEIDFVIRDEIKVKKLIQVCSDINDKDTLQREIRSLLTGSQELNCKDLVIINPLLEKKESFIWFKYKAEIEFIPLWKWFLQNSRL
jgi:predicted AAA+ superfamily ATPase